MSRSIAITGATGLVGSALCGAFAARGWSVRACSRTRPERLDPGLTWWGCKLPDQIDAAAFEGCEAIVHAAYTTTGAPISEARRVNELGSANLLALARRQGARFAFISSLSAHSEATSYYGKSKLAIERTLDPSQDLILRPGLVLARRGGLFGAMLERVRSQRIIPVIGGGRQPLQTIHIDDLCAAICTAVERGHTGPFQLAEPTPILMSEFIQLLARHAGREPLMIPVPLWAAVAVARSLELFGIRGPISSESVRGLAALKAFDTARDLERLSVRARSAAESLGDLATDRR